MVMALQGTAKLVEETGEVIQVLGKMIAFPYQDLHPDGKGSLRLRLEDEIGDVEAALAFVVKKRGLDVNRIMARAEEKLALFEAWDAMPGDATRPPIARATHIETVIGLERPHPIYLEEGEEDGV